ncbi:MAG: UDP-glucose 4-epimerase GalE [Thermodesulfobacteriota bacterium]
MNVLVTGGAGYIGSHCCKELSRAGHTPVTLDNLVTGHREAVQWGPLFEGDFADHSILREILTGFDIGAIMHFAAYAYVGESVSDPLKYYVNNVAKTIDLLRFAISSHIEIFIFSSSCATYGIPDYLPINEAHPQKPINPYGRTKVMVETILEDCARTGNLRYTSLRYFNAAGADPEGDLGEDHHPEPHIIPRVLDVAHGNSSAMSVYGVDYPTEDGTCVRDFIHVSDLAVAHVLALDRLRAGEPSDCVNIGTGNGYSITQIIKAAAAITGRAIPVVTCDRRKGDPPMLVADNSKAQRLLGWQAHFPGIEEILQTAWNWHRRLRTSDR